MTMPWFVTCKHFGYPQFMYDQKKHVYGTCYDQPAYQIWSLSFIHYKDMKGNAKCRNWVVRGRPRSLV